jgi:hypothetical protein
MVVLGGDACTMRIKDREQREKASEKSKSFLTKITKAF